MNKLNKKGITLIELIISISLISIVLIFLFSLLVDARNNDNQIDYDRKNQQTRAIIIKRVQDDFLNEDYRLISITNSESSLNKITFGFMSENGTKTTILTIGENTITYKDLAGNTEKWKLGNESSSFSTCIEYINPGELDKNFENSKTNSEFLAFKIRIPLTIKGKSENNVIDDLEFFYIGETNGGIGDFPDTSNLGKCN